MRLFSSLTTGRETLLTHGTALNATANNLSNQNTTAYKADRVEFSTLMANSVGNPWTMQDQRPGNGVASDELRTLFINGSTEVTDRSLDAAIEGQGFFVLSNGTDEYYTRAGNFIQDTAGNLASLSGETVMGFTEASPDTLVPINLLSESQTFAAATSQVDLSGNLDASDETFFAPAGTAGEGEFASFADVNSNSAFATQFEVIDSLGEKHTIISHFFHTDQNNPLQWEVHAFVDGGDVGGTAGVPFNIGSTQIAFNPDGTLAAGGNNTITSTPPWSNGSNPGNFVMDFSAFRGQAAASAITTITADGTVPGSITGVEFSSTGSVTVILDNGERSTVGTLALAKFSNIEGLNKLGSNRFQASEAAGTVVYGQPQTQGLGTIRGSALELSNVDPAREFVNVIRFQRGYQSGSSVIRTADEMLQSTIQLA